MAQVPLRTQDGGEVPNLGARASLWTSAHGRDPTGCCSYALGLQALMASFGMQEGRSIKSPTSHHLHNMLQMPGLSICRDGKPSTTQRAAKSAPPPDFQH